MLLSESLLVALFCMLVVFSVLAILWGLIRLFSLIIGSLEAKSQANSGTTTD